MADTSKTDQLFEAIQHGNAEAIRTMARVDPTLPTATITSGHGALHAAALHNRPELVSILSELGAKLELRPSRRGVAASARGDAQSRSGCCCAAKDGGQRAHSQCYRLDAIA
ncbi:MAG: hypothetical protein AB7L09_13000 [Nitrospira sp.]